MIHFIHTLIRISSFIKFNKTKAFFQINAHELSFEVGEKVFQVVDADLVR